MSAPVAGMEAGEQPAAEMLLDAFKTIDDAERQKHEAVLNYWLSIRGNRELPPLRDLDPLEISDAASSSALLELIGGGEDADIRHLGERLRSEGEADRISQAPRPSLLSSIARKLSIVAVSRNFLAFEDEFSAEGQKTRCWVTLLPLSSAGAWVDYVYAYVSFGPAEDAKQVAEAETAQATEAVQEEPRAVDGPAAADGESETVAEPVQEEVKAEEPAEAEPKETIVEEAVVEDEPAEEAVAEGLPVEEPAAEEAVVEEVPVEEPSIEDSSEETPAEDVLELDSPVEEAQEAAAGAPQEAPAAAAKSTGFSFDASAGGFYATKAVNVKPTLPATAKVSDPAKEESVPPTATIEPAEPIAKEESAPAAEASTPAVEEKPHKPTSATEGSLQSKLTDVRAKADEARMAKLRANVALYEGLSAAYDFALDAEDRPEEYLKIVEAAGLKIQLRSPMRPVVKLAFDGLCDDATIAQLEKVLAWAIDQELPRGSLGKCIEEAGGIGPILNGLAKAA
jgi:hypothetical protein